MKTRITFAIIGLLYGFFADVSFAQQRVVVLPFRNMDGAIKYNIWCFELADSLRKGLLSVNPDQKEFVIVDPDSVDLAISELNLDPTNAQYQSDVWTAVENLHADKVVQGNFFLRGERVLLNAYVYSVEYKMSDPENLAKDLYKTPTTYLESVRIMVKKLYPGLK
ncbi:MAG: hypothetical protein HQ472_09230 [Ignavibacteria bacterium]|nr:hypothetical protein [Ignavibacteria bacterium]